jgi:hypothetical protein
MMKPARSLQPIIACFAACVALAQQSDGPVSPEPPDEEDLPELEEEWDFTAGRGLEPDVLARLNRLVPEGRAHEGLRYPMYRERDDKPGPVLRSLFESRRVSRMDESHLRFEGAVFSSFEDVRSPGKATRTVSFVEATYDLAQDLLFSNAPVRIDDRQMSIHCGGMLHDRVTELTIFTGGVELFLHERPKKKPTAAPAAAADGAAMPSETTAPAAPAPESVTQPDKTLSP